MYKVHNNFTFTVEYRREVDQLLKQLDNYLSHFNRLFSYFAWKLSIQPDEKTAEQSRLLGKAKNRWKNKICDFQIRKELLTEEQRRQMYLLCRGSRFSDELSE